MSDVYVPDLPIPSRCRVGMRGYRNSALTYLLLGLVPTSIQSRMRCFERLHRRVRRAEEREAAAAVVLQRRRVLVRRRQPSRQAPFEAGMTRAGVAAAVEELLRREESRLAWSRRSRPCKH